MNRIAILTVTALIMTATGILGTVTISGTVFAQLDKDNGASELTPKEEPKIPGWDPDRAEEDAPGQEAEIPVPQPPIPGPPCDPCADDLSPGKKGLESGIIGPM